MPFKGQEKLFLFWPLRNLSRSLPKNILSCFIGQSHITCPFLNQTLAEGMGFPWLSQINQESPLDLGRGSGSPENMAAWSLSKIKLLLAQKEGKGYWQITNSDYFFLVNGIKILFREYFPRNVTLCQTQESILVILCPWPGIGLGMKAVDDTDCGHLPFIPSL